MKKGRGEKGGKTYIQARYKSLLPSPAVQQQTQGMARFPTFLYTLLLLLLLLL